MLHVTDIGKTSTCRIDKSGRIVLPKLVRRRKGLNDGDELIASCEDGAIVLRTYEDWMQRFQEDFCEGLDPKLSLVDELISERKQDAKLDDRC